jgi:hypothetical protein
MPNPDSIETVPLAWAFVEVPPVDPGPLMCL